MMMMILEGLHASIYLIIVIQSLFVISIHRSVCYWYFSEGSMKVASEATDTVRSAFYPPSGLSTTFGFKLEDKQGRMHRFNCGMHPDQISFLSVCLQKLITKFHVAQCRNTELDGPYHLHTPEGW